MAIDYSKKIIIDRSRNGKLGAVIFLLLIFWVNVFIILVDNKRTFGIDRACGVFLRSFSV